jgi:hypothetical protein
MAETFESRATSAAAFSKFEDLGRALNQRSDGVSTCMKIRWTAFRLGSAAPSSCQRRNSNDGFPFRSLDKARTNGCVLKQLCGHRRNGLRQSVHSLGGSARPHTREGRLRMGKDDVSAKGSNYSHSFVLHFALIELELTTHLEMRLHNRLTSAFMPHQTPLASLPRAI